MTPAVALAQLDTWRAVPDSRRHPTAMLLRLTEQEPEASAASPWETVRHATHCCRRHVQVCVRLHTATVQL